MRITIAAILCLCALPAGAQSLRGQWQVDVPSNPGYVGTVLVDADHRATWDSPDDYGRPARFQGYVKRFDWPKVEFALTNGADVTLPHCVAQSLDILHCYLTFTDKRPVSPGFILRRVGPGPKNLTQVSP